jgi:deazaflavin-dependent oxidoreductase (nitroreductase family)
VRTPDKVLDVGSWMLENGHRAVLKLTGGRYPKSLLGMKPIELFTIGRTSGQRRSTLLSAPICEDGRVVVIASNGGHQTHPQWYKNLAANPEVDIVIDGRTYAMRARTAAGEERAALWESITAKNKNYASYQRNTDREIPVVICEPA